MITVADLKAALPQLDGEIALKGLQAPVEVYRDQHGIPHIRASSKPDAFLAQGFVTAQDRLWQMECDRRRGAGRWAEVVGKSALQQDIMMRRFRLEASARADYEIVSDHTRAMFDAYARGSMLLSRLPGLCPWSTGLPGWPRNPGSPGTAW
jgi:penicillin G amidase